MKLKTVGYKKRLTALLIIVVSVMQLLTPVIVYATVASCGVQIDQVTSPPMATTTYNFVLSNTSPQDIQWIQVTRPSDQFTYVGTSINGWVENDTTDTVVWYSNTLSSGSSMNFQIAARANLVPSSGAWTIQVSDDPSGIGPTTCTGNTATTIAGNPPTDGPMSVSGVGATAITTTSATIGWGSDFATSQVVYYGTTNKYGNIAGYSETQDYTHSAALSGLTPGTTYHYIVAGIANDGSLSYSADSIFVTAALPPSTTPTNTNTPPVPTPSTSTPISSPVAIHKASESVPPSVTITTAFAHIYKTAPTIAGIARDNVAVAQVEYSTDGGQDWLPATSQSGNGTPQVSFSFTPANLQDGDYKIMVRVTDTSGNQISQALGTVVVDQLPPTVGGNSVSVGGQFVQPDADGTMRALARITQRIVLSAVGGPIVMTVKATPQDAKKPTQTFSLSQSSSTGLWAGSLQFAEGGTYTLQVNARDGAGNTTNRSLGKIIVSNPGKIINKQTNQTLAATLTVYYRDPNTKSWIVWDGGTYGQDNPMSATVKSGYSLYLPAGTYYLKVHKAGYHDAVTQIFTVKAPTPISVNIPLSRAPSVDLGILHLHMPSFGLTRIALAAKNTQVAATAAQKPLPLPLFDLTQTNGTRIRTVDVYGQPTIITTIASWSATSQEQLPILAQLAAEYPELRIMPVSSGESLSKLISQSNVSGYSLPIAVDATDSLASSLNTSSLPTNYFVNRQGMITKTVIGVLSKEELIRDVAN